MDDIPDNKGAVSRPRPVPLPSSQKELLANRKLKHEMTLNDHVDAIHVVLWEDEEYRNLLEAVYDEDATEGSLSYDNFKAADRIREYARENTRDPYLKDRVLASIVKSLNVVLRRYGYSRKERARTVAGEIVPNEDMNNGA
jgi:hypothetical protein